MALYKRTKILKNLKGQYCIILCSKPSDRFGVKFFETLEQAKTFIDNCLNTLNKQPTNISIQ